MVDARSGRVGFATYATAHELLDASSDDPVSICALLICVLCFVLCWVPHIISPPESDVCIRAEVLRR